MKYKLLIFITILFWQNVLTAQIFIPFKNLTGVTPVNDKISKIDSAAISVASLLSSEDSAVFRVYDAAFFVYDHDVNSGWESVKTDVESDPESEYYLIFGREISDQKLNSKIRVKLKLPTSSAYDCLTQKERDNLEGYIQQIANDKKSLDVVDFEVPALNLLKEYLYKVLVCHCITNNPNCSQFNNFSFLDVQLKSLGFRKKEIKVGANSTWVSGSQGIYDYFGKKVIIDGSEYDIADQVSEGKAIIEATEQILPDTIISTSVSGRVYILDNESFANGEWETAKAQVQSNDYVEYWVILVDKDGKHYIYSKYAIGSLEPPTARGKDLANRSAHLIPSPFSIALNALGNAAIDALIQTIGLRILDFDARSQPTELDRWLKAWSKVDKVAASWEGISSLIPWKKAGDLQGALLRAATSGIAVVIDRVTSPNYPNYTVKDGLVDFTITFGVSSLTQIIAQKFNLSAGPRLIADGVDNWYFSAANGPLKKIVFYVSKFYDDFKNGVVHAGKYWENNTFINNVKKIDLMGGAKSQLGGDFINIDIRKDIAKGIKGDATGLSLFIPANSIDEIVCSNPYLGAGFRAEDYIKEVAKIIKTGKKVFINGTMNNAFYNKIDQQLAAKYGFVIETFEEPLMQQFHNLNFFQRDGITVIPNYKMHSTVLVKQ
ncbi:MAG: hypothetical protein ACOYOA_11410 [Saprospiraceae bacterium]